ncbi:hypothetical protein C8R45DRAFT_756909, partial [Mycena sanguinolenta]
RKNCGCPTCHHDRTQLGCQHPGQCIETAKMLIDCIHPKWNPKMLNPDLATELDLIEEEKDMNAGQIQHGIEMNFDPNLTISNMQDGFRIFASKESLNEIP